MFPSYHKEGLREIIRKSCNALEKRQLCQVLNKPPIGCCIKREHNQEFQLTQLEAEQDTARLPPSAPKTRLLYKQRAARDAAVPEDLQQLNFNRYMVT